MPTDESPQDNGAPKSSPNRTIGRIVVVVVALGILALVIVRAVATSGGSDSSMGSMSMSSGDTMSSMSMASGQSMSGMSMSSGSSMSMDDASGMMTMADGSTMAASAMMSATPSA
ncbi:MAG: hypothetical protein WAX29_09280 [Propionibacterium sp.]